MLIPKGKLSPAELLVLRALCEPGTRWHHLEDLSEATGLTLRAIRSGIRSLAGRSCATGPPFQPHRKWSVTTTGAALLEEIDAAAGAEAA